MLFQQCPIAEDGFLGMRVNSDRALQAAPAAQTLQEGSTRCVGAAAPGQDRWPRLTTPRRLRRPSSHQNVQQPDAPGGANISVADAISAFGGQTLDPAGAGCPECNDSAIGPSQVCGVNQAALFESCLLQKP